MGRKKSVKKTGGEYELLGKLKQALTKVARVEKKIKNQLVQGVSCYGGIYLDPGVRAHLSCTRYFKKHW